MLVRTDSQTDELRGEDILEKTHARASSQRASPIIKWRARDDGDSARKKPEDHDLLGAGVHNNSSQYLSKDDSILDKDLQRNLPALNEDKVEGQRYHYYLGKSFNFTNVCFGFDKKHSCLKLMDFDFVATQEDDIRQLNLIEFISCP